jgi:hypothetical protein
MPGSTSTWVRISSYYLIWAGPNATGLKGAEHILREGENVGAAKGTSRVKRSQGSALRK